MQSSIPLIALGYTRLIAAIEINAKLLYCRRRGGIGTGMLNVLAATPISIGSYAALSSYEQLQPDFVNNQIVHGNRAHPLKARQKAEPSKCSLIIRDFFPPISLICSAFGVNLGRNYPENELLDCGYPDELMKIPCKNPC